MTAPTPGKIDVAAIKATISLENLIEICGVSLKRQGPEWVSLCPFHTERTPSFKVTPKTQLYYCNGCGAGGDHFNFIREFYGLGFKDAAAKLSELVGGIAPLDAGKQGGRKSKKAPDPVAEWIRSEAPLQAPPPPTSLRVLRGGDWIDTPIVAAWPYRSRAGMLVGYTCRIEFKKPDGDTGKDVIPITWQTRTSSGESRWRQGAFDKPRPLYGAELLDQYPDAQIVLVEGEKACDAGRRLFEAFGPESLLVLTWAGGCKAVAYADWSVLAGRKIAGWPDCDSQKDAEGVMRAYSEQPGMLAMLNIAEIVATHGAQMRIVAVPAPGSIKDGWDLADAEAEGWGPDHAMRALKADLAQPEEIRELDNTEQETGLDFGPDPDLDALFKQPDPPAADPQPEAGKKGAKKKQPPKPGEVENLPMRALGFNHGRYYYLSRRQRQVHEYQKQDHSSNGLLQLAPLSLWSQAFAYGGQMKGENWQAAVDCLMRKCEEGGIFDTAIIRGRGCWNEANRMIINLGNRIIADGKEVGIDSIESRFIYEAGARLAGPIGDPLTVAEARIVLDISKRFNWEMAGSAALLAGWIVLAPLCGALPWRPHIWLTGGTGTGKSTILEKFIAPMMAGLELQVQGNSTEAGIRQSLRADARPVIFDESEQNDDRDENRIQNVLALARQSSSESQSRTLKGTTTGKHLEFHVRSMFCLASIQVGIKRQADQTRIAVLGLYGDAQVAAADKATHQEKWRDTEKLLSELFDRPDFAGRLMARSVAMYPMIRQNMRTMIRAAAAEFKSQRLGDTYGTLLAGAATLMYDHPISEEGAIKFIRLFDWSTHLEAAKEDESADALTAIMQIETAVDVTKGTEHRTLGELVRIVVEGKTIDDVPPADAAAVLGRWGVRVRRGKLGALSEDAGIMVATKSDRLTKALRGAPWAVDWRGYLRRLAGAKSHSVPIRFSDGYSSRAVFLPINIVLPDDSLAEG